MSSLTLLIHLSSTLLDGLSDVTDTLDYLLSLAAATGAVVFPAEEQHHQRLSVLNVILHHLGAGGIARGRAAGSPRGMGRVWGAIGCVDKCDVGREHGVHDKGA